MFQGLTDSVGVMRFALTADPETLPAGAVMRCGVAINQAEQALYVAPMSFYPALPSDVFINGLRVSIGGAVYLSGTNDPVDYLGGMSRDAEGALNSVSGTAPSFVTAGVGVTEVGEVCGEIVA